MNLSLRPWNRSDFERIAELANNPKIAGFLTDMFPHPYAPEDAEKYFDTFTKGDKGDIIRAICLDRKLVGSIGLHTKADVHRHEMELGYWLGEPYWGRGIVSWAIEQMIPIGFSRPEVIRIYAEVMSHNPASARVLEKSGFTFEGRLKLGFVKGEKYYDSLRYGLVKED
ncbi:MAG: GNAT family N-acetyltransferase [Bacteroidota bacterium]